MTSEVQKGMGLLVHTVDGSTSLHLPDLSDWDRRPKSQLIPEKSVAASPYIGGSHRKPRDIRTLRRWREARCGPSYLKIGGRYFYTVCALREFFERSVRTESSEKSQSFQGR